MPASQERHADLRHFKAAFASLSPSHREVLVLYGVHGLPYEQIAEVVGREVGSVKSRMNRARTALKALMDGEPPGEEAAAPRRRRGRPAGTDPVLVRPAPAPTGLERARVLVVEDEPVAAMDVAATLRRAGGEAVGPAYRLDRALRCAAEESFDAALLDVRLGGSQVFPVAEIRGARRAVHLPDGLPARVPAGTLPRPPARPQALPGQAPRGEPQRAPAAGGRDRGKLLILAGKPVAGFVRVKCSP